MEFVSPMDMEDGGRSSKGLKGTGGSKARALVTLKHTVDLFPFKTETKYAHSILGGKNSYRGNIFQDELSHFPVHCIGLL